MSKLIDEDRHGWEPNPLVDVEIPTLLLSKQDMVKFFIGGLIIGFSVMAILYSWLW